MEAVRRKPFQGTINVLRFNRHFYLLAAAIVLVLAVALRWAEGLLWAGSVVAIVGLGYAVLASVVVTLLVYDLSGLNRLAWLDLFVPPGHKLANIHAGFDETSALLAHRYPQAQLTVLDFYDTEKHTEVSIRRARALYPPYPGTVWVSTDNMQLEEGSTNVIFCILSAHEIRKRNERIAFFLQLRRALKDDGKIVVVEHLRNAANAFAYTAGVFHFHAAREWQETFRAAGLAVQSQKKFTPFLTVYYLSNADAP